MAKDDDRTNKPEEAGKWGTAGKSSGKNNKNGKGKEYKTDRRIDKVLQLAADRIDTIDSSASVPERLARAAKSSELLSAVWSLPPAHRLMFHHGMQVTDVEGDSTPGFDGNKEDAEKFISISSSEIARYQRLMYANGVKGSTRRLLIVLQGMDASGKGGIVRHVFSQGDPMGIHYHGFGKPAAEELDHDFLWRVKREVPKAGWIAVFDRSHYEDVVMPHVYGTYPEDVWRARYDQINDFERELADSGCAILKIFLVVSQEEQKKHFLGRLDDPTKFWKFDISDLEARDLVVRVDARGQDQHRHARKRPDAPAHLHAVHVRQPQVQDHQRRLVFAHGCHGDVAAAHHVDRKFVVAQVFTDKLREAIVVLDQQHLGLERPLGHRSYPRLFF